MNNILITRIADNKTFSEESLAELLRDEGISYFPHITPALYYLEKRWEIYRHSGGMSMLGEPIILDPAKYKISFANTLDIEGVREMIARMREYFTVRSTIEERPHFSCMTEFLLMDIDSIASKYVNQK